eukprot:PhM_4_TR10846/c0_g1_i1/m.2294
MGVVLTRPPVQPPPTNNTTSSSGHPPRAREFSPDASSNSLSNPNVSSNHHNNGSSISSGTNQRRSRERNGNNNHNGDGISSRVGGSSTSNNYNTHLALHNSNHNVVDPLGSSVGSDADSIATAMPPKPTTMIPAPKRSARMTSVLRSASSDSTFSAVSQTSDIILKSSGATKRSTSQGPPGRGKLGGKNKEEVEALRKQLREAQRNTQRMSKHYESRIQEVEKLKERVVNAEAKANQTLCPVCMDNDVTIAFPCGHVVCSRCDTSLEKCPMCRIKIRRRTRLYFAS